MESNHEHPITESAGPRKQYQNYGSLPQHPSYTPKTVPIDFSRLEQDPSEPDSDEFVRRTSTGSTIADPASIEMFGRTFTGYKEGSYFIPNDAVEQDRLNLQHKIYKLLIDDKLYLTPLVHEPRAVLDIGTGTGIWAIEFAEQHPTSLVIGTDLSQIQPVHTAPENCMFVRADVEEMWTHQIYFDYIHLRAMVTCFNDHKNVAQKIYDNLNPGGYVEYQDFYFPFMDIDGSMEGTTVQRWNELVMKAGLAVGRDFTTPKNYKNWLDEIGFVDVMERSIAAPLNPWPKNRKQRKIGAIASVDLLDFVGAFTQNILSRGSDMPAEEINDLIVLVKKDILNTDIKMYMTT